ncbi:MAG: exodeoxyribonuclease VII large subunit [Draconibacterium sp.]|nr:exodeoxyribonuclease VII large subunit [Draconibacterium sp.]
MNEKLTLLQLNESIKDTLHDAFSATVWVVAEVSELKINRSGHCYLELIEKEGNSIIARSRATIWSYTFRMLKPYFETSTGQQFSQGIKILVQVAVEYHTAYGLSLNIKDIDPTYTVGDMALQRKEIINRLQTEGVFDMNKELELPLVPQKIAVISSATAAGFQDFMSQLDTNEFGFKFYTKLFEATMQGAETVPSIIRALDRIFNHEDFFDAVVIIRGGGAAADLSSFDNYDLAFNVTQFPLPVISGIGHEKDDTIVDLVAHTRMKTPTAVAEFLIAGVTQFYDRLLDMETQVVQFVRNTIDDEQNKLEKIATSLNYSVSEFINEKQTRLTKMGNELQQNVSQYSFKKKYEINNLKHDLESIISLWFVETKNSLEHKRRILKRVAGASLLKNNATLIHYKDLIAHETKRMIFREQKKIHISETSLRLLTPENILKRGYSLTLKDGKIIKLAAKLIVNDEIETMFADGKVQSKIIKNKK